MNRKQPILWLLCFILIFSSITPVFAEGDSILNNEEKNSQTVDMSTPPVYMLTDATVNLRPGESKRIAVRVRFGDNRDIKILGVTATVDQPNDVFIMDEGSKLVDGEKTFYYNVQASDLVKNTTATITYTLDYKYKNNDDIYINTTQTATTNVRVLDAQPSLTVSRTDIIPSNQVKAGDNFTVGFEFTNAGTAPVKNVVVSLNNLSETKVGVTRGLSSQTILNIPAGGREYVDFELTTSKDTPAGNHEIPMSWKVSGEEGNGGEGSFFIFVSKGANADSTLVLENVSGPAGTLYRGNTFNVNFDVKNQGTEDAKNVLVKTETENPAGVASRTVSQKVIPVIKPGQSESFSFEYLVGPSAETQNYPVKITVSYEDDSTGEEKKTVEQYVGAFVKAPDDDTDDDSPKSTPKLIIDKYSFDPTLVPAGSTFDMTLSFFNTNQAKTVKNIKIFLTSTESTDADSNTSGSSVFTPVDSSNTFYIDSIPPKGRVEKTISMYTVPDASAKTYEITANFEYEDGENNPYTATELIGVPVIQESKLEVGEISMPTTAFVGEPIDLMVDFFNTGKVTLYNTMVKATGDFTGDNLNYYLGNFESGASDMFNAIIYPNEPGEMEGKLVFTYEDSTGEEKVEEREFSIMVEDAPAYEDGEYEDGYPGGGDESIFKKPLFWIIAAIVVAVIVFIVRKIRKNKSKEGLELDE